MAEALIHLTQHADRNVREVELVPVQLQIWLEVTAHSFPTSQDGLQMLKDFPSDQMLGALEEAQVCFLARPAVGHRDALVDEREEVAVERLVEPCRCLRGLFRSRERVLEFCRRPADAVATMKFVWQHDAAVDEESEEQRTASH